MAKLIEAQRIESCDQCPKRYISENESGCAINYQKGNDAISDCPLPDAPEWLPKPDENCLWWFWGGYDGGHFAGVVPFWVDTDNECCYGDWKTWKMELFKGTWLKATVPPLPEESKS